MTSWRCRSPHRRPCAPTRGMTVMPSARACAAGHPADHFAQGQTKITDRRRLPRHRDRNRIAHVRPSQAPAPHRDPLRQNRAVLRPLPHPRRHSQIATQLCQQNLGPFEFVIDLQYPLFSSYPRHRFSNASSRIHKRNRMYYIIYYIPYYYIQFR